MSVFRSLAPVTAMLAVATVLFFSATAGAQLVQAEPRGPAAALLPPGGAPPVETQVTLQLVVDAAGTVESALEVSRLPRGTTDAVVQAAIAVAKTTSFVPSTRDGRPIRSRIEYVVVLRPAVPATATSAPTPTPAPAPTPVPTPATTVQVRGFTWSSPRGLGDVYVDREALTASPRQQTTEMLSAAPGFFVDHEDGEGLGNDVYLRGFDLDNGSGIEMKVDDVPINVPLHIHGQGYADANFIIPEVVQSVRVLEGPYDPRQGDSAIVGSALFNLGVAERGYQLKSTYGSFNQARVVAIAAPVGADDETFAAFAMRETQGFGQDRASKSASVNAQYGVDFTNHDHLRLLATAYGASAALPGVVRLDDVNAGRIGYYDAYPNFNTVNPKNCMMSPSCEQPAQGVDASRVIVAAQLQHSTSDAARIEVAPWLMWTNFTSRQNYTGNIYSSNVQPGVSSLGDLWQLTNGETAGGVTARFHGSPVHLGHFLEAAVEPGASLRAGHTDQTRDLLNPANLQPWDYRENYGLSTLDLAGYLDLDVRLWKKLRVSGGVRADFLDVAIDNKLAGVVPPVPSGALQGQTTNVTGIAPGPRATVAYAAAPGLMPVISVGEGFRSLDAGSLVKCNGPTLQLTGGLSVPPCARGAAFSKVTSFEAGFRSEAARGRYVTTLAAFQTDVANELVFEATQGGLTTEGPSTRRGVVSSFLVRPWPWLLVSSALSVQTATYNTLVVGVSHKVPYVPAILWRADVNVHGQVFRFDGAPVTGRAGVGFTLLGGKQVTDTVVAPTNYVLNALASARWRFVELGLEMYNVLGLQYPDDEEHFFSNWSFKSGGQQPASLGLHVVAAAPRTTLGTVSLYF